LIVIADCRSRIADWLLWGLGLVLVVVGYFGSWIPHRAAALTVTGSELSWFSKSFGLPSRELFVVPMIAAAILFGLAAQRFVTRPIARVGVTAAAVLLALFSLPIYDSIFSPEYRGQLTLTVAGIILVLLTLLVPLLPRRMWGALIILLALVGVLPALWLFSAFHPRVVALYNDSLGAGWGLVVCVVGFALLLGRGILAAALDR
jgi:hypothetical protein